MRGRCLLPAVFLVGAPAIADPGLDYARDVRPILEPACGRCHAGEHVKGGLRLDALGDVIVPGASGRSRLYGRLAGSGGEPRMPKDGPPLTSEQLALVRRWIDEGAAGLPRQAPRTVDHWAYRPPVRPALPAVHRTRWPRTPIDRFVLARLEAAGLAPAPLADRATRLSRASLDLTGLPPTPEALDAFLADRRPDAWERVVDRLLASPHFGERWAIPWLDAARYADSNGYEKDGRRSMWRYRDWVVAALNDDLPFDRLTVEQLAGDLLPGATPAQRIATGFHRNTMLNEEAGVDPEEARWERLVDRTATTATVWLGTTLGCAQCHDHKYDPFTQRDFYRLLAFFDDADEVTLELPTAAQATRRDAIEAELRALERTLTSWTPALGAEQQRWEARLRALPARFAGLAPVAWAATGAKLLVQADGSVLATSDGADVHTVAAETALASITALRIEALPDGRLPGGGPGLGESGNFFLSGVELEVAPRGSEAWEPVSWRAALSDDRPPGEPERYAAQNLVPTTARAANLDPENTRGWGVFAVYDGSRRLPRQAVLLPERPFGFAGGTRLRVRLRYDEGEPIGRLRLSVTDLPDPEAVVGLPVELRPALSRAEAQRSPAERDRLAEAYRAVAPSLAAARARRDELLRGRVALEIPSTLALAPGRSRVTYLRQGGAFTRPGPAVTAGLPAALAGPAPVARDRLALARWLASEQNPLVARVVVNRIWAQYFGRGLVETVEDLGTQGAAPSHPELLDWLATELVRSGWRLKALHRLIVTSAMYQQAAGAPSPRDPANRLLGRFPRLRLDAELVRDRALAASGLLDPAVGGPPVFPAQPARLFAPPNSTEPPWAADGSHRRSLYTFWRRTAPHPTMALFDAPSREVCTVRRSRTNTPLQALVTLNDPIFWEAAEALGRRMAGARDHFGYGFRLCTGRWPRPRERRLLDRLYRRARARGSSDDGALALVANTLLNLDETLTRN